MPRDGSYDLENHRDDLATELDDGGGCCEAWEALTDLRSENSPTRTDTSRRTFLSRAAATLGVSLAGLQAITDRVAAATEAADVTELTGRERKALLGRALSDHRTREIRRALVKAGHTPRVSEANAVRTEHKGDVYHTVVIPFSTRSDNTQAYLTWSDNPTYDVQVAGHHIVHRVPPDAEAYWDITLLHVVDGEIVVEQDRLKNFLGCDNVSWGCVLTLAGAYSATFISCAVCVGTSGWLVAACGHCIAAILGSTGATLTCDWCND